jgi:hypothetical protein
VSGVGAVLVLVGTLAVAVVAIVAARLYQRRRPLVRFPEIAAERPNDLNFGYAIILGFVLVAALGTFQDARQAATTEARAVTTLSRSALAMPPQLRDDLSHQLVCYAREVIAYDWGDRQADGGAPGSRFVDATSDRISQTVARAADGSLVRDAALGALLEGEAQLREARAQRLEQASRLPVLFWVMIVIGAVMVITLSAVLMASEFAWLQAFITCGSALIIGFTLVLIGSLDEPYASSAPLPVVQSTAMQASLDSVVRFAADPAVDRPCP